MNSILSKYIITISNLCSYFLSFSHFSYFLIFYTFFINSQTTAKHLLPYRKIPSILYATPFHYMRFSLHAFSLYATSDSLRVRFFTYSLFLPIIIMTRRKGNILSLCYSYCRYCSLFHISYICIEKEYAFIWHTLLDGLLDIFS